MIIFKLINLQRQQNLYFVRIIFKTIDQMSRTGQNSPMLFDLDTTNPYRFRHSFSNSARSSYIQILQRQLLQQSKQSGRLKRPNSQNISDQNLSKRKISGDSGFSSYLKKPTLFRQKSQPNEKTKVYEHQKVEQDNQNIRQRLTSLQKYFDETISLQIPYKKKKVIMTDTNFIQDVEAFTIKLSINKNASESAFRRSALRHRPQMLQLKDLQKIQKQKKKILIDKILKQRLNPHYSQLQNQQHYQQSNDSLHNNISKLKNQIQQVSMNIRSCKKYIKQNIQTRQRIINRLNLSYK